MAAQDLEQHLAHWADGNPLRRDVAATVSALAGAGRLIAGLIGQGALAGPLDYRTGPCSIKEQQRSLDLLANGILLDAVRQAPVAAFVSEELAVPLSVNAAMPLLVAADPIDGATGAGAGICLCSTFSILPAHASGGGGGSQTADFNQPGSRQLAAGLLLYGAFTALALTVGAGTHIFTLDRTSDRFLLTSGNVRIPVEAGACAIEMSGARHWPPEIRTYIDDCQRGRDGPRGKDFAMRWSGSVTAEAFHVLTQGGIVLRPGDVRVEAPACELALLYQIAPLAFLIEQAGGAAISGARECRNMIPTGLHDTAPFAAGSRDEIARLLRLQLHPDAPGERSQLFGHRGLFWT